MRQTDLEAGQGEAHTEGRAEAQTIEATGKLWKALAAVSGALFLVGGGLVIWRWWIALQQASLAPPPEGVLRGALDLALGDPLGWVSAACLVLGFAVDRAAVVGKWWFHE